MRTRPGGVRLPAGVAMLGMVSLFMDISSEMIHALLPVFMVNVLGASMVTVGLIEGLGEGLALVSRVFAGALSDWLRRRKLLILIGYSLATLVKPLFALAQGIGTVVTARAIDRIAKGIRGAPRDALVADLSPPELRGAAFGLRQSLDSLGAFIGPLLAIGLMMALADDIRSVFWFALIPGLIAVLIIVFFVHEPASGPRGELRSPLQARQLRGLSRAYWQVLAVSVVFTLARFSEAFLILRAQEQGLALAYMPLVLMLMSLVYALGAYPVGALSDRVGRMSLLSIGLLLLLAADLTLAYADSVAWVMAGTALWGLHMAFTQGLLATLVADTCSAEVRGTAFGVQGLVTGVAVLLASLIAGALWEYLGPAMTFFAGAGLAGLTLLGFLWLRRQGSLP